ncbi:DUF4129 domain-containing protein [Halobacterium jilantaiense]|uniref:Protein-glutamine gamma-glutamyltransferase-like C-terminal domain-containing protein n=1 Tax=Halobacterium jilantaiense TaxID=355548 RepID=A0A1I0P1X2_9EURY|nr:DUF4129 domain-containing protein [Halobacterium jilantaiense]SEW07983.1 protein of unknown function [Halobacterium jilantaiense]
MTRRRSAVVLALVCVVAVSLAAATLPAPTEPRGSGTGSGDESPVAGEGAHQSENASSGVARNVETATEQTTPPLSGVCVPVLRSPAFFAVAAVLTGAAAVAVRRRVATTPTVVVVGGAVLSAVPFWLAATDCRSSVPSESRGVDELVFAPGDTGSSGGGEAAAEAATTLLTDPVVVLGVVAVVASLVVVAYHATGDDPAPSSDDASDESGEAADSGVNASLSVAAAAGDAADRIEAGADVDNEVYRAWRAMAAATGIPDPGAATPAEFAAAARDAGMPAEDVAALTDVFREVRYGDAEATPDREQRAVDALRSLQTAADRDAALGWDNR